MNKKLKLLIVLFSFLFLTTGCTKYVQNEEGPVTNEITGQRITENILCKPTNPEVLEIYAENNIDLTELIECEDFKISTGGYEGLWESIFVKPLAYLILKVSSVVKYSALAIIIVGILLRIILFPITKKTALQSELLKQAKPEIDKIEKKYKDKTEKEDMMKKSQETMAVYKKYKINPASGCIFAFLQMPILFAFIEAINRVPAIFEETFLKLQLGTTPWVGIFNNGQYYYIVIVILLSLVTYFSFKLNVTTPTTGDQGKQMKMMNNMMIIFISIMSFTLSTAISLYWISSSVFTIGQNLIIKKRVVK